MNPRLVRTRWLPAAILSTRTWPGRCGSLSALSRLLSAWRYSPWPRSCTKS